MNKKFRIEKTNNKFIITTDDDYIINKALENESYFDSIQVITTNEYVIEFSKSLLLKDEFLWLRKIALDNGFDNIIDDADKIVKILEEIKFLEGKSKDIDFFINDAKFLDFKKAILSKFDGVSDKGEYADITIKQLIKTFIYSKLDNVANFSEPGSGKTITSLMMFFDKEIKFKKEMRLIIVCPINAINVWREEIINFTNIPEDKIHIYRKDFNNLNFNRFDYDTTGMKVIILNYEAVDAFLGNRSNKSNNQAFENDFIIYDEVHRIKSGKKYYSFSNNLADWGSNRVILTGTPYSTEISELKNLFELNWNGSLPTISDASFIEYNNTIRNGAINERDIFELKEALEPYYFKLRKKEDFGIADAIDCHTNPIDVEPLKEQVKLDNYFNEKIAKILSMLKNEKDFEMIEKHKKLLYANVSFSQINSVNPSILFNSKIKDALKSVISFENLPTFEELPKIKASINYVRDIVNRGEKVIVWMRYKINIESLTKLLNENGLNAMYIHGDISPFERTKIIDEFNNDSDKVMVLVTNPDTLAESISLHKYVHNSLFVERGFSYYQWIQAKDRIHRVGMPEGTTTTHQYLKSSKLNIDNKIFKNLSNKLEVDKKIFGELIIKERNSEINYESYEDLLFNANDEIGNSHYNLSIDDKLENNERHFDYYDEFLRGL